jgi:hypothetical protein
LKLHATFSLEQVIYLHFHLLAQNIKSDDEFPGCLREKRTTTTKKNNSDS